MLQLADACRIIISSSSLHQTNKVLLLHIFTPYVALDSGGFTDPLFLALTACVMDRVPPTSEDVFPLYYDIDWVRVYEWVK